MLMLHINIIQFCQNLQMVDRYRSLVGSQLVSDNIRNIKVDKIVNNNMEMISRTNEHAAKMREFIGKYKRDPTNDADRFVEMFKKQQKQYVHDRNYLKLQVEKLQKNNKKDTPEYNFMKKELIKAVKSELDLEFQLNQEITAKKQQKELLKTKLIQGSVQLQNVISDIEAKKAQILYLERLMNECLQLLEIIGVLVHQNGQKIDLISERIHQANIEIEKAEKNIDKAKMAMQKSRCKWCCILILAIVVIILGLVVYFGIVPK